MPPPGGKHTRRLFSVLVLHLTVAGRRASTHVDLSVAGASRGDRRSERKGKRIFFFLKSSLLEFRSSTETEREKKRDREEERERERQSENETEK